MSRRLTSTAHLDALARWGSLLVAALVIALPLTMAFCPPSALDGGGASGAGAGTGDAVAAALSGIDRGLNATRLLPAPERVDGPALVADLSFASTDLGAAAFDANAPPPVGSREAVPGDARPGQAGLGHHLRR